MKLFSLSLIIVVSLYFSCGSLKTATKEEKNLETRGDLPPMSPLINTQKRGINFNNSERLSL